MMGPRTAAKALVFAAFPWLAVTDVSAARHISAVLHIEEYRESTIRTARQRVTPLGPPWTVTVEDAVKALAAAPVLHLLGGGTGG
jgi:hypothetical protein